MGYLFLLSIKKSPAALPKAYLTSFNNNLFAKRKLKTKKNLLYFSINNTIKQ
jgi:hypothetical protein